MNIWDIYNKSGSNKTKKNVQALNFKEFDACLNDLVLALKEFLDPPLRLVVLLLNFSSVV